MAEPQVKLKICLVGDVEVGKTSLLRRFTTNEFSEKYLSTIGMNVAKKEVVLPASDRPGTASLLVYDIMGQRNLREPLKEAYFRGAQGILAVCDLTRRETLQGLEEWIRTAREQVGDVPVVVVGNKVDLADRRVLGESELTETAARHRAAQRYTSAKTGEGVEEAFQILAQSILETTDFTVA